MAPDTIEIFVHELDEQAAFEWLGEVFEDVEVGTRSPTVTYHAAVDENTISIQVTENVQNGPYTSIWFNADDTPWGSTTACAEAAHEALGREVLCYPDQVENPWQMSRFVNGSEERVDEREINF